MAGLTNFRPYTEQNVEVEVPEEPIPRVLTESGHENLHSRIYPTTFFMPSSLGWVPNWIQNTFNKP